VWLDIIERLGLLATGYSASHLQVRVGAEAWHSPQCDIAAMPWNPFKSKKDKSGKPQPIRTGFHPIDLDALGYA
jgi:hypothetical protein